MPAPAIVGDAEFLASVHAGLGSRPRHLPCRYFYDLQGSLLFEEICDLPEYYLTRAEDEILRDRADEIAALAPEGADVVELGSGSARKTRRLLQALLRRHRAVRYVPIDISAEMLRRTADALLREYPRLVVEPVTGEYQDAMEHLGAGAPRTRFVLFLGSNLGNFHPEEAVSFLRQVRSITGPGGRTLLGLDLQKDPAILNAAYDDARGVTARFNLNLLQRINRELDGDFDPDRFQHRAFFNQEKGRVEMHLMSACAQRVTVAGRAYEFQEGETIHTESSYKYTFDQIREMGAASGFDLAHTWQDAGRLFSLNLLAPVDDL